MTPPTPPPPHISQYLLGWLILGGRNQFELTRNRKSACPCTMGMFICPSFNFSDRIVKVMLCGYVQAAPFTIKYITLHTHTSPNATLNVINTFFCCLFFSVCDIIQKSKTIRRRLILLRFTFLTRHVHCGKNPKICHIYYVY